MMNSVNIIGRFTRDPDLRYTPNGKAVANGTLAVQRSFKNAQGEHDADFINVVIWGKIAEVVINNTSKGKMIGGTGRLQSRSYENNENKKVFVTEVVIDDITMIEWNNGKQSGSVGQSGQQNQSQDGQGPQNDPFKNNNEPIEISDDDLPF